MAFRLVLLVPLVNRDYAVLPLTLEMAADTPLRDKERVGVHCVPESDAVCPLSP